MKQLLIEVDDATAARLEQVAPARSRRRSAFVRDAIQRALDQAVEAEMAAAYRRQPDDAATVYLDAAAWEPAADEAPRASSRRRTKKR